MATNPTSSNILSGIQSIQGNRHAARLNAYNNNLAERQVYDTASELLANQIQQQEKQNKFISNALGIKNTPSSNNMWNSHHALLSEEYEAMFNDDVLKAVSQDEMLSAKWLADLNELNKRINEAEQFFAISFGDPSKGADQASYSGWRNATQDGTMEYNDYWKTQGLSTSVTNQDIKNKAAELDTKAHTNVEYVPGQGFNVTYEDGKEGLFDFSPENASTIFFAPVEQATFNPPVNYANDSATYSLYKNSDEEGLRQNLQSRKSQMELDVAEFARQKAIKEESDTAKKAELEAMTARQYRDKLVNERTFDTQYKLFEDSVVDGVKNREQREEEEENNRSKTRTTTSASPEAAEDAQLTPVSGDDIGYNITGGGSFVHNGQPGSFVRSVQIDEDGDIAALIQFGDSDTELVKLDNNNINTYVPYAPNIIKAYNALVEPANFLKRNVSSDILEKIKKLLPESVRSSMNDVVTYNEILQNREVPENIKKVLIKTISKSSTNQKRNPFDGQ